MSLKEKTHYNWGGTEQHTYVRGTEPIDGVWVSPELEVVSTMQLLFHGDHRSVLIDNSTRLAIG